MRLKLKYVLPALQMLLAVALLVWTDRWQLALMRLQDMPGTPPSFTLLIAINAPLAMPGALMFRYLPGWWDHITLVVAIGIFWYWVSLNIESWQQSRRVFMFSWIPLRLTGDAIAVGIGTIWFFVLSRNRAYSLPVPVSSPDWLWFVPCFGFPMLWGVTLILLFGRDFVQCLIPSKDE
jgi:hypothetical protein